MATSEDAPKLYSPDEAKAFVDVQLWRFFVKPGWTTTSELAICQCGRLKLLAVYERFDRRVKVMVSHSGSGLEGNFPRLESDLEEFLENRLFQVRDALGEVKAGQELQMLTQEEQGSPVMELLGNLLHQIVF